jgi:hypothetical protein
LHQSELLIRQLKEVFHFSQVAGFEPGAEIFVALAGCAVGVLLRRRESGRAFLQAVIADRVRGFDSGLEIPGSMNWNSSQK